MKKCRMWILLLPLLLCGCGAEETFETVGDELILPVMAEPREILVQLPEDAAAPVLETEEQQIFVCDNYEIILETLSAGDVSGTIRAISGYEKEQLTVMETQWQDVTRYEFVWASAGESGDRLGRAVILDDGHYHYCMSALRDADSLEITQISWDAVFQSFELT